MNSEATGIRKRFKRARIGVKDAVAVIDMTLDDQLNAISTPTLEESFAILNRLIDRTAHGTRIERSRPKKTGQPFHTFDIHTKGGEILGYLNMIYFRKPLPCYYLVYVEVFSSFRGRGLGNRILRTFKEFLEDRAVVGLLDNIIPLQEPTFDIYTKLGWKPIGSLIGATKTHGDTRYMIFVPNSARSPDLRRLSRLLFRIQKKRPIIDMHDNESMVKRTIAEFQSVYRALESLFEEELAAGTSTPLMRFMFTRFVTKVLGFKRRIATLLGYTGGESLEQISISETVRALPIQPYSLWNSKKDPVHLWGEEEFIHDLPEDLKAGPTSYIENLAIYKRPYWSRWMDRWNDGRPPTLKIRDLLELGFDPTKLREFRHEGIPYICERLSPRFLPSIHRRKEFLSEIALHATGQRFRHARLRLNPPLAIVQDRGNAYVLRKKVEGIHAEEALDQLRTSPHLREMNSQAKIDRAVIQTVSCTNEWLRERFASHTREEIDDLVFFVPWSFEKNLPRLTVDLESVFLEVLWIA